MCELPLRLAMLASSPQAGIGSGAVVGGSGCSGEAGESLRRLGGHAYLGRFASTYVARGTESVAREPGGEVAELRRFGGLRR